MSENPVQKELGANTLDFTGVKVIGLSGLAGLLSINADIAQAQTLAGDPQITVTDLGGGAHVISLGSVLGFVFDAAVVVPDSVRTTLLSNTIGPGTWIIVGDCNSTAAPAVSINAAVRMLNNAAGIAWASARTDPFNPVNYHENFGFTLTTLAFHMAGTETITLEMYQESGTTLTLSTHMLFARIGN